MRRVKITQASDYDLVGDLIEDASSHAAKKKKRVGLRVVS
jgi:hypothetical protein